MKLLCGPKSITFDAEDRSALRVILFGQPANRDEASAGAAAGNGILRAKLGPAPRAWDLLSLALSVVTADFAGVRDESPDGWTRQFDLEIAVSEPDFWNGQREAIAQMLSFLTTDTWKIDFRDGGWIPAPPRKLVQPQEGCVLLLSGGLDSLVGAIDLVAGGRKPLAVSQVVRGDAEKQTSFASILGSGLRHLQLNHTANPPGEEESSQRARSLIFLTFGVLAATTLRIYQGGDVVPLFVCENGFIAINPPLTGGRIGSLSTRTAHPEFLFRFQELLKSAGLRVAIHNPYAEATKGEMLQRCAIQKLLKVHAVESTSCGRYQRFNYTHCGRCVPCQVRRAAFLAWGVPDETEYVYGPLGKNDDEHARFDDVRSVAMAIQQVRSDGLERWIGPALRYPRVRNTGNLISMIGRGIGELEALHRQLGVK